MDTVFPQIFKVTVSLPSHPSLERDGTASGVTPNNLLKQIEVFLPKLSFFWQEFNQHVPLQLSVLFVGGSS